MLSYMNEPDLPSNPSHNPEDFERATRREWQRPELIDLGSVEELTEFSGGLGDDGTFAS